jgi:hypothetical protein
MGDKQGHPFRGNQHTRFGTLLHGTEKATGTWFEQSMRALPGRFGPALDDEDTK